MSPEVGRSHSLVERLLIDARPKARLAIPGLDPKRVDTLLPRFFEAEHRGIRYT